MDHVRFGIVGAGQIAHYVAWVFRDEPALTPIAIADSNPEAAASLAGELGGVEVYTEYRQLLARDDIDAVYLATPPFLHRPMVLDAIAAGKHIICEKPFMLNCAEVLDVMAAASREPALKVGCCSCRFHDSPTAKRARQMIVDGELGPVYRLWFDTVSRAYAPGASLPAWRNDPAKNGGGIAYDWGVYDLDWISYVLADQFRPLTLMATLDNYFAVTDERRPPAPDVDGRIAAEILCADGLSIHWERRSSEHGPARHRVEIRGRKAGLDLSMIPDGNPSQLVRHAYVGANELASEVQPEAPPDWRETLVYPIRDLAAAIMEDRLPASPPNRQLVIHALLDAFYASVRSEASAPVDLV